MKTLAISMLALFLSANAFSATAATVVAKDEDGKTVVIALDSKGTPRIDGKSKTYPTIKDFADDADYVSFCYTGTLKDAEELLTALVDSANGDGDSWAELKSVKSNSEEQLEVIASITDEGGEHEESYSFPPCK